MDQFLLGNQAEIKPEYLPSARIGIRTMEQYRAVYGESVRNLGGYWSTVAAELEWSIPWDEELAGELPHFEFFKGGYSNVSVNCIDRHALKRGDQCALIWSSETGEERRWTYQQLLEETARFASRLQEFGVGKGDVVAIFLPNLLETFAAVHACYRVGAVYNIVFSGFSADALYDRLVDTQPKVVVTADGTYRRGKIIGLKDTLDRVVDRLPSIRHVVVVRRSRVDIAMTRPRDVYWDEIVLSTTALADPVPVEANDPGFIIYTSGTTSRPKGLVHSALGFLVGTYHNVKYSLDLGPEDVYWCTADVGWLTFPIFELVGALANGVTAVVYEGAMDFPDPSRFYRMLEQYRINKIFTAPTWLRMLARYGTKVASGFDMASLQLIGLVGEPLDPVTWRWVKEHIGNGHVDINNTYGQSETGSAWVSSIAGVTPMKPGSCGLALPGHAFQILDDAGRSLGPNTVGTLALSAPFPALARTLWHDDARFQSQYFSDFRGRYSTFDSAVEDFQHHLWILGRTDDVINVAAHRLSTMEMESAILRVEGVAESAVIGIDDTLKGQVPVAFVTVSGDAPPAKSWVSQVQDQVAENIGSIARPSQVIVVEAMPKTRSGKIVRRLLKEILLSGDVAGDITGLENPEVIEALRAQIPLQQ